MRTVPVIVIAANLQSMMRNGYSCISPVSGSMSRVLFQDADPAMVISRSSGHLVRGQRTSCQQYSRDQGRQRTWPLTEFANSQAMNSLFFVVLIFLLKSVSNLQAITSHQLPLLCLLELTCHVDV